jgi:hypothetical protein
MSLLLYFAPMSSCVLLSLFLLFVFRKIQGFVSAVETWLPWEKSLSARFDVNFFEQGTSTA